jgi:hypothetical protein
LVSHAEGVQELGAEEDTGAKKEKLTEKWKRWHN